MRTPWVVVACLAGCQTSGAVELSLDLPPAGALRPSGMTTVTVTATGSDGLPTATTSLFDAAGKFAAGDIPVGTGVQIDVLLRDAASRLVGVGEASSLVDISGTQTTSVGIPVRRPFVYAATPTALVSFDPSLDARDPAFQGSVGGIKNPLFAVSAGGDLLAVVTAGEVLAIDTSTNALVGTPIALPGLASDATAVPGTHQIAVAYANGIAIVDLDAGTVTSSTAGAAVDRVTVGAAADGTLTAYGLIGRVAPPAGPFDTCSDATATSQIVSVPVATPSVLTPVAVAVALSDIAADPSAGLLFATAPCAGKVESIAPTGAVTDVESLERAAVLSVLGGRVWAAGSHASSPVCLQPGQTAGNSEIPCVPESDESCPPPQATETSFIGYVRTGASLIVESIPTRAGQATVTFDVPDRRQSIINTDDSASQHAEVLNSFSAEPIDLVALPGGQYVSLVARSSYFIQQLGDQNGFIVIPCLKATTADWLLMDMASVSVAGRVRTSCALTVGPSDDEFVHWACDTPTQQETSTQGTYEATSVGALFGAR